MSNQGSALQRLVLFLGNQFCFYLHQAGKQSGSVHSSLARRFLAGSLALSFFLSPIASSHSVYGQMSGEQQAAIPRDRDSDGDGLPDWWELQNGRDHLTADSDGTAIWQMATNGSGSPSSTIEPLPAVSGEIAGYSAGEFSVAQTGVALYRIKLGLPPGTGGMEPRLALTYGSDRPNGILGLGWSLGGLSELTRVSTTLAQEGSIDPVDFDSSDRFALDGKRLVAVSGTYGANGTEYRTENDSFFKIVSYGSAGNAPARFRVWGKDGLIYDYGFAVDAQVQVSNGSNSIITWKLSKLQDTKGNYIEFLYDRNVAEGTHLIREIRYTGNDSRGVNPFNKITFIYEDRPDQRIAFLGGTKAQQLKRLKEIEVYIDSELVKKYIFTYVQHPRNAVSQLISFQEFDGQGNGLAPTTFQWQNGETGFEEPVKWQEANRPGSNSEGYPFRYNDESAEAYHQEQESQGGLERYSDWLNEPTNSTPPPSDVFSEEIMLDMNGDGRLDRLSRRKVHPSDPAQDELGLWVRLNTGNGFAAPVNWISDLPQNHPDYLKLAAITWREKRGDIIYTNVDLQDMNGDGLPDRTIYINPQTNVYGLWVALNTGQGFAPLQLWDNTDGQNNGLNSTKWTNKEHNKTLTDLVDMNGDRRPDRVFHKHPLTGQGGMWVMLNNGNGFNYRHLWAARIGDNEDENVIFQTFRHDPYKGTSRALIDVNGDGLPDRYSHESAETGNRGLWISLNTGTGFAPEQKWWDFEHADFQDLPTWYEYATDYQFKHTTLIDMNGDGLPDRVSHHNPATNQYGLWVGLNNGKRFEAPQLWWNTQSQNSWRNHPEVQYRGNSTYSGSLQTYSASLGVEKEAFGKTIVELKDVNGDNLPDRVSSEHDQTGVQGLWIAFNTGNGFTPQQLWQAPSSGSLIDSAIQNDDSDTFQQVTHWAWIDVNGDGLVDFVRKKANDGLYVGLQRQKPSLITAITNGHGYALRIQYKPLTDPAVHTRYYNTAQYPECDLTWIMPVVSEYSQDNGLGGENRVTYRYEGLKVRLDGRGIIGFRKVESVNTATGLTYINTYRQDFPFNGLPDTSEIRVTGGGIVSHTQHQYGKLDFANHYSTFLSGTTITEYELDGSLKRTTTTAYIYDTFGNPTQIVQTWNDGYKKTTVNQYTNDTTKWHIGRLTRSTVTSEGPYGALVTRVAEFVYDTTSGLLTRETEEPGTSYWLRKTYTHDGFGNITATLIEGAGITSRTETTQYDTRGQFPISKTNALGHTETREYDRRFGTISSQTGPNGLTTTWDYDGFGRKILETRPDGTKSRTSFLKITGNGPLGTVYAIRTDVSGQPPVIQYCDILDRPIRTETIGFDGQPVFADTVYDDRGQVWKTSEPYRTGETIYWTINEYDTLGRIIRTTAPDGSVSTAVYQGLTVSATNALNQTGFRTQDSQGQLVQSTDSQGNVMTYTHDPLGHLLTVTSPAGHVTSMSYNSRGQRISLTEPNTGTTTYQYNVLGELLSQTNARNQTQTFTYDKLGRVLIRQETEGTTTWTYDTAAHGIGKPARVTGPNGFEETYVYDDLGRVSRTTTTIDGEKLSQSVLYDAYSRVLISIYPTGFAVKSNYNGNGYLVDVRHADSAQNTIYWQVQTRNARGQIQQEKLGTALTTTHTYRADNGRLQTVQTQAGGVSIQQLNYQFDVLGNLTQRQDQRQNLTETFLYDNLNRLTSAQVTGQTAKTVQYDALGNITYRSDVGTYTYGNNAGPNAVTSIQRIPIPAIVSPPAQNLTGTRSFQVETKLQTNGNTRIAPGAKVLFNGAKGVHLKPGFQARAGSTFFASSTAQAGTTVWNYTYDANGNRISGSQGETVTYTSFNKPKQMQKEGKTIIFTYSPDRTQLKKVSQVPDMNPKITTKVTTTTFYLGSYERQRVQDSTGDKRQYIHYVGGGNGLAAVVSQPHGGAFETKYILKDHLGSIDTITNAAGTVLERFSYDAWGKRRNADWTPTIEQIKSTVNRGFTGHEPLDEVGLVNMKGRVYDPTIGRFLQADPFVQEPDNSQNLNRYTYVLNNPLSLVDPTGYFWQTLWNIVKIIIVVALVAVTGGWAAGLAFNSFIGAIVGGAVGGFVGGMASVLLSGGSIQEALTAGLVGAAIGGLSGGLFHWVGDTFKSYGIEKILSHGVVGGIRSVLSGGRFEHGFYAGAFTQTLAPVVDGINYNVPGIDPYRTAVAAVAGGTAEMLGGGKFLNGAVTGAFSRMFNDDAKDHQEQKEAVVRVRRFISTDKSTISELTIDGTEVSGYTLEPPGPSSTTAGSGLRIPAGEHPLKPFTRPNGDSVYQIEGVEGRDYVLIHVGNYPADTQACLLPGTSYGTDIVYGSNDMAKTLFSTLKNYDKVRIVITDDF